MITVHHLENSRSQRILWLLEELGAPYDVRRYERDPKTMLAPESLRKVHPLGKSPVIEDDGLVVAESGAIVEYLIGRYGDGRLRPEPGTPAHADYLMWLHAAEASLQPLLLMALLFKVMPERSPALARPLVKGVAGTAMKSFVNPRLDEQLSHIDRTLGERAWFAGEDMSGADMMMIFPLEAAQSRMEGEDRYPNIAAYVAKIHGRDAYKRALERGGPYAYA